jgi:hypothetical protein
MFQVFIIDIFGTLLYYTCTMLKLKQLLMLTVSLNALAATSALAGVTYDKGGMPNCIAIEDRNLLILWNKADAYSREIYTVDSGTTSGVDVYNCQNPPEFANVPNDDKQLLPKGAKSVGVFSLNSPRIQKSLAQIRAGANSYREEADAKSFLRKFPILNFSVATNRKLTAMYGVGFTSEIYSEVVAADANNKAFSDLIANNLHVSAEELAPLTKNREVIYVKGLAHELSSSKQYDVLVDNLRAAGMAVKVVKTNSYDTISKNAGIVKAALDMELKSGKNLILVGLSKGGSESLLGLSMLTSKLEGAGKPAGYGKVEAYLGLSGVYGGSFLVDYAGKMPLQLIFGQVLKNEYKDDGKVLPSLDGVLDIRSESMDSVMKQVAQNGLPQETSYFNLIGTMSGDGLAAKGNYIRRLQDEMIRTRLENYGANDGYIEYPGTAIPQKLVKKSFTASMNSSHALIDGTFLNEPVVGGKDNVVNAISISVLQLISK